MERVKQRTLSHCGPAVLEMLLTYLDIKVNQDAFVDATGVAPKLKRHGMTVKELSLGIKRLVPQVQFWYKHHAAIDDITTIINTFKHPVGVEWQGIFGKHAGKDKDDGHYSIITWFDQHQKVFRIADPFPPFAGRDRRIAIKKFESRWWDLNEVKSVKTGRRRHVKDLRMLFIITPKKVVFPKDLGMRKG